MSLAGYLKVLELNDLERIHEESVKILEETGILFQHKEAKEIFKKHGAKIEGDIVYISKDLIDKALSTIPRSFYWYGTKEENKILMGEGQERTHISPNNGCVFIQDLDNGKRNGTIKDLDNVYKLCHHYSIVDIIGAVPVHPYDLEEKHKHLKITQSLLKNTDRPLIGVTWSKEEMERIFEMVELVSGKEGYLDTHATMGVSINPLSPLKFDDRGCETIIEFAKRNQPVFILPCAMSGVSAPISLMGTAVLINSEMLAGLALVQLTNPGCPCLYSPASTPANMRKASYITGSPEANIINIACIQLAKEIYHIPTRSMAGLTDAKVVDCQAGYETMQNLFQLMCAKTDLINECLGVMDSIMTLSYEKFILDVEMMSRILRFMEGMDTSEKGLQNAIKDIKKVSHKGSYLTEKSSVKGCRKLWTPEVSDWNSYQEWEDAGALDVSQIANAKYKEILKNAPEMVISEESYKLLDEYVKFNINKIN